jgi:heterodisulfide reductase subunit C
MRRPEACVECSLCATVCPVEKVGGSAIVSFLAEGMSELPPFGVWLCTSCWRCQEVCPQGVDIYGMMMGQRRRGSPPEGYRQAFENILACGYTLCIRPEVNELRAAWGLEPVEPAPPECVRMLLGRGNSL